MLVTVMDVSRRALAVKGPRTALGYTVAVGGTTAASAVLLLFRDDASKTNVVLTFLLVVVAAAATGGLGPGLTASGLGFLAFDFLFLPPYHTFIVNDRQDYLSLGVYLLIALVVSLLVGAVERRRMQAERRERETRTLFELSTSLVAHGGLDDTLERVARTVRALFGLAGCAIVLADRDGGTRIAASDGVVPDRLDERFAGATGDHSVGVRGPAGGDLEPGVPSPFPCAPARRSSARWWWWRAARARSASARPSGACSPPSPTRPPSPSSRGSATRSGTTPRPWSRRTGCAPRC
jgi:two-component system sensor histidine kinase KdpD